MGEDAKLGIDVVPETQAHPVSLPVSFHFAEREITMYSVTEQELDSFTAGYTSLHSVLFGVAAGALIPVCATVATVPISNVYTYAAFVAAGLVGAVATLLFGGHMVLDYRAAGQQKRRIKAERRTPTTIRT